MNMKNTMEMNLKILQELEVILKQCSQETFQRIQTIIKYITNHYTDTKNGEVLNFFAKKKKKKKEKETEGSNMNTIKNYFKVLKKDGIRSSEDIEITEKNDNVKVPLPVIRIFFFYGTFNIIIIIYYIIFKFNKFNEYLFVNDENMTMFDSSALNYPSPNMNSTNLTNLTAEEYVLYNNQKILHIICSRLSGSGVEVINNLIDQMLTVKMNTFKIFILEAFDQLAFQYRKILLNKLTKTTNLIFIESSQCLNDVYLNNCLYTRIPIPNATLFHNYFFDIIKKKDPMENLEERKEYVIRAIKKCNYDIPLILTILYYIQVNNFPDLNKIFKLITNSNVKRLISIIQKGNISSNCMFLVRNILYQLLEVYTCDINSLLTILCKNIIQYHKNDDQYKREVLSLFSEYSHLSTFVDNPIFSLENLCSQLILIEKKFVHSLVLPEEYVPTEKKEVTE